MAYPAVDGPYGLIPVKRLDGLPYAGAVRHYRIASGYAANIFTGDPVKLVTGGTIEFDTPDAAMTPVGIFLGCSYTDADLGFVQRMHWPSGQVADDAVAYVCDDPNILMKVAIVSSGTTIGSMAITDIGANATMVNNTGSTATGKSRAAISQTSATAGTEPLRIVDLVEETRDTSGGYTEALVKWNAGHQMNDLGGV
jgi:hypothetical protein